MAQLKIVLVVAAFAAFVASQETFSDRFDAETDADRILGNETERMEYLNCFLGKAACSPAAEYYTGIFPEMFLTQCQRCTDKQKTLFQTTVKWYMTNRPDQWNVVVARVMELAKAKNVLGAE